ncbi:ABC transporter permease [Nonomuraea muscovyensis]|uniref:Peptide/nickel transport system permease protein n=1 Tax=Nonomuraea muscovyensis TaxID=1124761 RepID=A0A7X0C3D1_9ACTN|nr:ABC transporter permease [Nonomuraea muscovyensis]MBB6347647.1 peptide/nickel transport system permease protein [Nonomuraea muscovyensis]
MEQLVIRPGLRGRTGRLKGGGLRTAALVVIALLVLAAVFAPLVAPADPDAVDLSAVLAGPSADHLLGADASGRDLLSRMIYGARTGLLGPLGVVALSTVLGVVIGLAAAWHGGWVDTALSRSMELVFAFPGLLLAMLVVAMYGPGQVGPVITLAVAYTPFVGRMVRGMARGEMGRPYIAAYRALGFGGLTICLRHLLPNIAPVILAQSTVNFGYALLDLAGLAFLGLGVQPPAADWGAMINEGQSAVLQGALGPILVPGLAIVLSVIAFNIVGESLADRVSRR